MDGRFGVYGVLILTLATGCNSSPRGQVQVAQAVETDERSAPQPELNARISPVDESGFEQRIAELGGKYVPEMRDRGPRVILHGSQTTDETLAILSDVPTVESLWLSGAKIDGSGLRYLQHPESLKTLLVDQTLLRDESLEFLKGQAITVLNLSGTAITDRGIDCLADCSRLEELTLSDTKVSDASCDVLARLPSLKNLSLEGTSVTDAGVAALSASSTLQILSLGRTGISDASCGSLALKSGGLFNLDLHGTRVTNAGVSALLPLAGSLTILNLADTSLTDDSVSALLKLEKVTRLWTAGSGISETGLTTIKNQHPGRIQINPQIP